MGTALVLTALAALALAGCGSDMKKGRPTTAGPSPTAGAALYECGGEWLVVAPPG